MSQEETWEAYCRLTGGELTPVSLVGDGLDLRAVSPLGPWSVALDTVTMFNPSVRTRTAMKLPFFNPSGLKFTLQENNLGASLKGLFGKKPIACGSAAFDKKFAVTGSDADKIRQIFGDPLVQDLVARQPHITLEISQHQTPEAFTGKLPKGVSMLVYYDLSRKIKDPERLKLIYDLLGAVMNSMQTLGLVGEGAPPVDF